MPAFKPVADRIRDLSIGEPNSGCWLWIGSIDKCGYGKMCGRETLAHRASYATFVGPIPSGCEIDHKCKTRACVNPTHLQAISHAENIARGDYKTNHRNRVKTHCIRGHEFSLANTHIETHRGMVMRKCRECRRLRTLKVTEVTVR